MAFRGKYEHSLDAKNRLTIPARFRAEFAGGAVVAQSLEKCAAIWTHDAFERFTRSFLDDLNPLSKEAQRLSRFFHGGSFDVDLDGAGRVMIASPILAHAGIGKEVWIVGNDDHLELWDRATWDSYEAELNATVGETAEKIASAG